MAIADESTNGAGGPWSDDLYRGVLNHKFAGQGTLKVQGQGTYVGHFKNGRFTGSGEYIAPSGWRIKDDFGNGVLRGSVQLREGRRTYTDKILKDGQLEYAH